jgi:hypothetical protein
MVLPMVPVSASAAQDVMTTYFKGGIQKPQKPYIQHVIPEVTWDEVFIWFDKNDDFNNISTDCLKDPEGFYKKFGLEDCRIVVQFDAKVDNGNWLYNASWDSLEYDNWYNRELFSQDIDTSPDWYASKTVTTNLMYAYAYNFDEPNENGIFKGTVKKSVKDGYDAYHLDITNHTFSFRYRIGIHYLSSSTYEWGKPVYSAWSDVASIGKNSNQKKLTKSAKPAAPKLSNFTAKAIGDKKNQSNEYNVFLTVPDSIYQDEKYYVINENIFEPIGIEVQSRVNGGKWTQADIANGTWLNSGYRLLSLDPVQKNDKVEVRMRFREGGNDVYTYSAWSNIVSVIAPTTDYNADITSLDVNASEKQVTKYFTSNKAEQEARGAVFSYLQGQQTKADKTAVSFKWKKDKNAKYYIVYGSKCGKKNSFKKIKKVKTTSFTQKKLKKGTYYKYIVAAFDKNDKLIGTTCTMHIATKGGKVTNYKKVTTAAKKNKVTLKKKGKTFSLKGKGVQEEKKLKVNVHRGIRYESSNPAVATVGFKNGKVTAKKKGTCYIYVYGQNGKFVKVKVTVKK